MEKETDSSIRNEQNAHWEKHFSHTPEMFGEEPSRSAKDVAQRLKQLGSLTLVELGAGQGRDSVFFAHNGFKVHALDYSSAGVASIQEKARQQGIRNNLVAMRHDVRAPLPFKDNSQDSCYAHMLFCMALTTQELVTLTGEVRRILKPGGICAYTVRHTGDAHFGKGIHRGEAMYEHNGFIVHFFDKQRINTLADGFEIVEINEFDEGDLPRKLSMVVMKKRHE